MIEADDRAVGNVPFFDDWLVHDRADPYWRAIDGEDRARNVKAPVLLMGGWYDPFLPTQIRDFQTIRREADPRVALGTRLIVGPWMHADAVRFPDGSTGNPYRRASLAPSIPWFDHHLRGMPLANSLAAPVRILRHGRECLARRTGVAAGAHPIHAVLSAQRRTRELGRRRRSPDTRRAKRARARRRVCL